MSSLLGFQIECLSPEEETRQNSPELLKFGPRCSASTKKNVCNGRVLFRVSYPYINRGTAPQNRADRLYCQVHGARLWRKHKVPLLAGHSISGTVDEEIMAATATKKDLVHFLVHCSRKTLLSFLLARQNHAANLERTIRDVLKALADDLAFIEMANIIREHGEELVGSEGKIPVDVADALDATERVLSEQVHREEPTLPLLGPKKVKPIAPRKRGNARS
jgi:hypothetical protein